MQALCMRVHAYANVLLGAGPLSARATLPWRAFVAKHGPPIAPCYAVTYHSTTKQTEQVLLPDPWDIDAATVALCNSCAVPPLLHGTGDCVDGAHTSSFPQAAIREALEAKQNLIVLSTFPLPCSHGSVTYDKLLQSYVECGVPQSIVARVKCSSRWSKFGNALHVIQQCGAVTGDNMLHFNWHRISATEHVYKNVTFIAPTTWQRYTMLDPFCARAGCTRGSAFKAGLAAPVGATNARGARTVRFRTDMRIGRVAHQQ